MSQKVRGSDALNEKRIGLLFDAMQIQQDRNIGHIQEPRSALNDLDKLLEMIVDEARHFTGADAGTLYILEDESLRFKIFQNDTMRINMDENPAKEIDLPPVKMSLANVSSFVAMSGETVNIPDVYDAQGFDFTGPKKYDDITGYRSKSMLAVPMRNRDDKIIGVLQLLNAKERGTGNVIPFGDEFVSIAKSLASLAGVAITTSKTQRNDNDRH
jgi:GAF domain-containing protein